MIQKVKALQTDDGDWFVIPEDMVYLWETLETQMVNENYEVQETIDTFYSHFEKYATGGDLNNTQLYAEI